MQPLPPASSLWPLSQPTGGPRAFGGGSRGWGAQPRADSGPELGPGPRTFVIISPTPGRAPRARDEPGKVSASSHPRLWGEERGAGGSGGEGLLEEASGEVQLGEGATPCQVGPGRGPRRGQPRVRRPGSHWDYRVGRLGGGRAGEEQQGGWEPPLVTWRALPSGAGGREGGHWLGARMPMSGWCEWP